MTNPLRKNYQLRNMRLKQFLELELGEVPSLTLEEKQQAFYTLLHGLPPSPTIIRRKMVEGRCVEVLEKGIEVLCYLTTLDNGFIALHTMEYNEDGRGMPLSIVHDTGKFFSWHQETYPGFPSGSGEHNIPENIRAFLQDILIPTYVVIGDIEL